MTNDLLTKATALLETRDKATPDQMYRQDGDGRVLIDQNIDIADFWDLHDADFYILAANTAAEIVTGYQDLVRQMADALQAMGDFWAYGLDKPEGAKPTEGDERRIHELASMARKVFEEARAALPPA
jgi:hypothetical protein